MFKFRCFAILFAMALLHNQLQAQNNVLGGWYFVNLNYHFNNRYFLYSELQTRSQHLADDFNYREIKGGAGYKPNKNISLLLGYGNYKNYTFPGNFNKPVLVEENRLWEQFILSHNVDRFKFEHRVRTEQRWINGVYNNRFRYRLNVTYPLNHPKVTDHTFFVYGFDEIFFSNLDPYFIRNRILGGAGYRFSKTVTAQTGFIRQTDYKKDNVHSGKNFIQLALIFTAGYPDKEIRHSLAD